MVVNFEFLGDEPIENVITCLHFKVDKVVYFGYHDEVQAKKKTTDAFLKKYCGVNAVVFHELSQKNLQSVLRTMRTEIQRELENGADVYFDVTGGENLILVAFGMLSKEFDAPIHLFDVEKDELIELNNGAESSIGREVERQKVKLDLERYIELRGGVINWGLHKNIKSDMDEEFTRDVAGICHVAKKHINYWNPFSDFLRNVLVPVEGLKVSKSMDEVNEALRRSKTRLKTLKRLNRIVDDLAAAGVLLDVVHADGSYSFRFKDRRIKEVLWEGGSILELHTYEEEKKHSDDCKVGVHLDWDGVINRGSDVLNEIDVLSITGNVPTFISCKSGRMSANHTLHALYELDTVAGRFGGKYAKKVLVSAMAISEVYAKRAAEMGIEIRR